MSERLSMSQRAGAWCARVSVRHRIPILLITGLLLLGGLYPAIFIEHDASYETWFLESDPSLVAYGKLQEVFGNDEFMLVMLEVDEGTVFTNESFASLNRVTDFLENANTVERVVSLSNYETIRSRDDELSLLPAIQDLPMSTEALRETQEFVLADPMLVPAMVSADGFRTNLVVELELVPNQFQHRIELLGAIEDELALEKERSGLVYKVGGGAVIDRAIYRITRRDFLQNIILVSSAIFLLLLFSVRSFWGAVLPMITVVSAVILSRLFIPLMGWKDNNMLMIVPLVVLGIGIADSVHVVVHFLRKRGQGLSAEDAIHDAITRLFQPCLLTTATTMIGFLALLATPLAPLRQLGACTSVGVFAAFFLSVLPLPAALSFMSSDRFAGEARLERGFFSRLTARIPEFVRGHRSAIIYGGIALGVLGLAGITQIKVESNALKFFHEDDPVRLLAEEIEEKAGGIVSLEMVLSSDKEGRMYDPDVLRGMEKLAAYMDSLPLSTSAGSFADYIKAVHFAMNDNDPEYRVIPEDRATVSQYMVLYEASAPQRGLETIVDISGTTTRVWARAGFSNSSEYGRFMEDVTAYAGEVIPADVNQDLTGIITLYKNMGDYIVWSQVRSFLSALVVITIVMMIAFRSVKLGLLSLIPNLWPILITMGFMGWTRIWLEPSTAMVAAVTIGIAVDDSVHFLSKYLAARQRGQNERESVDHAFEVSGRAIVFTTAILLSAFGAVGFSQFTPYVKFGMLCGMAIFLALVGDLFVLPAIFERKSGAQKPLAKSKKIASLLVLIGFSSFLAAPALAQDQEQNQNPEERGRAIMEAVQDANDGLVSERADLTMVLRDKGGRSVTREFETLLLAEEDKPARSLIRFTSPSDIRGTSFLTYDREEIDDQWLYLPALGKVKRIAASKRGASFLGSQLSYEDLGRQEPDDYDHTFVRTETYEGLECEVVSSVSKLDSGYSKVDSWVMIEQRLPVRVDYYDKKGRLLKQTRLSNFEETDGYWRAQAVIIENVQNGKVTELSVRKRYVNATLDENELTVEALSSDW